MYALIDSIPAETRSLSQRLYDRLTGRTGVTAYPERLLGGTVLRVSLEFSEQEKPKAVERRIETAVGVLRDHKIRRVCFSDSFPYKDRFLRESFAEPDESELLRPLSGKVAASLAGDGEKTAAIYFSRHSDLSEKMLWQLAGCYRRLIAGCERSISPLCQRLLEDTGISVLESHNFTGADVAVFLDTPRYGMKLSRNCIAVCPDKATFQMLDCKTFVSDVELALPEGVRESLPAGFPERKLLALFVSGSPHSKENIQIKQVVVSPMAHTIFVNPSQTIDKVW